MDLFALLETAEQAARGGGELVVAKWAQPYQISKKGLRDWVTDVDVAAQKWMTTFIGQRFPEHGFLTEEQDEGLPAGAEITWIIDPIDGTSNYSRKQPIFCISIGVATGPKLVAGVIFDPLRQELFGAVAGQGARLNGQPIHVSQVKEPQEAIISHDWSRQPTMRQQTLEMVQAILHTVHTVRGLGSAALALAWLASGRLDGYFHLTAQAWDLAAGSLLVTEAGGKVSDMSGRDWSWLAQQNGYLASNAHLHPTLHHLLAPHYQ